MWSRVQENAIIFLVSEKKNEYLRIIIVNNINIVEFIPF